MTVMTEKTLSGRDRGRLVLVTGVCGFIGSHVAQALLEDDGVSVLGVDQRDPAEDPRTAATLKQLGARSNFHFVQADAGDPAVADHLHAASTVVHLAAPTDVAASWTDGFAEQVGSLMSWHRLLNACQDARVERVVVASSAHVYGPIDEGLACEDLPVAPSSPYGVMKLAAERLAMAYARRSGSKMSVVALRFFTAYGLRSHPAMVVQRMFRSAWTGQVMPLYGDGHVTCTWTHIEDLVDAVLRAIEVPLDPGAAEVVNVAGGDTASLLQVADMVGQIVGRPVRWEHAGHRPGDAAGLHADLARAGQLLGFQPGISLRQGLEDLWEQLRSMPDFQRAHP